jgi:hypothetical protein
VPGRQFADWFVVSDDCVLLTGHNRNTYAPAVEAHIFIAAQVVAEPGRLAVHQYAPFANPGLDLPPRTQPGGGQQFLNALTQLNAIPID